MSAPTCKLCGQPHWLSEPHTFVPKPEAQLAVHREAVKQALIEKAQDQARSNAKHQAAWRKRYPEKHAAQQKAYRQRKKVNASVPLAVPPEPTS